MTELAGRLLEGPLDIIGDVHGELEALRRLLERLGVDLERSTASRPLVFVGDLIDRGPDSPGVVQLVKRLFEAGVAQVVMGNHELNLLRGDRKEGNGWFFGHADGFGEYEGRPFESISVETEEEAASILDFFSTLPLTLERGDLRVVHACWHRSSVEALPATGDAPALADAMESEVIAELASRGILEQARRERSEFAELRDITVRPTRMLAAARELSLAEQLGSPLRVVTSGLEAPLELEEMFFTGGKWRLVERVRWWKQYDEPQAVVCGHYWRRRHRRAGEGSQRDLWDDEPPYGWAGPRGNVFCVDYSVGRRFKERWSGVSTFEGGLAALRWPERELVFDDRADSVPTTGFGKA